MGLVFLFIHGYIGILRKNKGLGACKKVLVCRWKDVWVVDAYAVYVLLAALTIVLKYQLKNYKNENS